MFHVVSRPCPARVLYFAIRAPDPGDKQWKDGMPYGELQAGTKESKAMYCLISRKGWDSPRRLEGAMDELLAAAGRFPHLQRIALVAHLPGDVMGEREPRKRRRKLVRFLRTELLLFDRLRRRLADSGICVQIFALPQVRNTVLDLLRERPSLNNGAALVSELGIDA